MGKRKCRLTLLNHSGDFDPWDGRFRQLRRRHQQWRFEPSEPRVNRDTSSQLNDQQSIPASEAHGEEHGHKHEPTVLAKRKDTSKSHTLKKTNSKKQKTSPPLVVDATEGHVEESIMKPTEVSHSVQKGQQESDEVHETDQLGNKNLMRSVRQINW